MNILQIAQGLHACQDAIAWLEDKRHLTAEQLYSQCPRGDWLLWFFARIGVDRQLLALAACDCADLAKHLLSDNAPKNTTDIVRAYYQGKATLEDVKIAANAAGNAYAADAVASVAAFAAYAAYTAANAAIYATAANAAANAAGAAVNAIAYTAAITNSAGGSEADHAAAIAAVNNEYYAAQTTDKNAIAIYYTVDNTITDAHRQCADIVRRHVSFKTMVEACEVYK